LLHCEREQAQDEQRTVALKDYIEHELSLLNL
jgi:hypothetical protein